MNRGLQSVRQPGRDAATWLIAQAHANGIPVVVTSGLRTWEEQQDLIRRGLTRARSSNHLNGQAFDLGVSGYSWQDIDPGVWRWLGELWESIGGRWGGRFKSRDPIHFDW